MQIQKISNNSPSFNSAKVNILALSDTHGNVLNLPLLLRTVENNSKDIFSGAGKSNTRNIFAIAGDWFINPSKKGFRTQSNMTNGVLQNLALNKVIHMIKEYAMDVAKTVPFFDVVFTPGNHDLDSGDEFLLNVMKKNQMISLITNVDLTEGKSPAVKKAMEENSNILQSKVFSIQDDKNPEMFHKVLFMGVTIPSMKFYNPGLLEGMDLLDDCNQKDANLTEENLVGTINAVKEEVEKFKSENPKGAVILLSHMGERLSEMVCDNVPQINMILNAHDHINKQTNIRKTSINSLGKDNEMIKAINLEFDDKGDLRKTTMESYVTGATIPDGIENHPFQRFLNNLLAEDVTKLLSVTDESIDTTKKVNKKSKTSKSNIAELSYGDEIRYANSYLLNYLTSAIKSEVEEEKLVDNLATVAIPSSIVRGGLKNDASNLDLMKVFDGVSEKLSNLMVGSLTGQDLVDLITENVKHNLKAPTRSTIIQWSDVMIDRKLISEIFAKNSPKELHDAIMIRNPKTEQFEPIELDKDYKIVINEKYLLKTDIDVPQRIRPNFVSLNRTYDELFKSFLERHNYKVVIDNKTKETRIINR